MAKELNGGLRRFILPSILSLLGLIGLGVIFETVAPQTASSASSASGFLTVLGGAVNFVAEITAQAGWVILPVTALWLLIRGLNALAAYVATVALGTGLLVGAGLLLLGGPTGNGAKQGAEQGAESGIGNAFSSGSVQLAVTSGVLFLVFLPVIPPKGRPWAIGGAALAAAAFDTIRVLTGAVPSWPVIGGWIIGLAWLAATAWAFRRWRKAHAEGQTRSRSGPSWGLGVSDRSALMPAPVEDPLFPAGRRSALGLTGIWVLLAVVVTGLGLLITEVLPAVQSFDEAVVQWVAGHRSNTLSVLATIAGSFGTTGGIIGALIVLGSLALAITRRAAPAMFLLTAVVGETALYLLTGLIIGRPRPDVDHLSEGVPPTSSFPSGHVAAAVVLYSGFALLLHAWAQSRLRNIGFILAPLIVVGVLLSRLYWGVHYPTDTLVSLLFAAAWVYACWRSFKPKRGSGRDSAAGSPESAAQPAHMRSVDATQDNHGR